MTDRSLEDLAVDKISTHTLRKEGDLMGLKALDDAQEFQPTPSARRVTSDLFIDWRLIMISTHTLRKEGDEEAVRAKLGATAFQPTPSARRVTGR